LAERKREMFVEFEQGTLFIQVPWFELTNNKTPVRVLFLLETQVEEASAKTLGCVPWIWFKLFGL